MNISRQIIATIARTGCQILGLRPTKKRLRSSNHWPRIRIWSSDAYLLELVRYIHLNPVRARMVTLPVAYPWSSHHTYLGIRVEPWVTTDLALSLFHPDSQQATTAYHRFVHAESMPSDSPLQHLNPNDARILGSDTFAAVLLGAAWQPRSHKTLNMLMDEACQQFNTTPLNSASRSRQLTHARAWVAHQALLLRITTLTHITHVFGRIESALRQSVKLHFNYP